ncbi:MAG: aldo/keto reductase [Candidatus Dadabacteria bacterium]|nr:aldo/keto reductase [Candidatus Dadabacteria bacterium]
MELKELGKTGIMIPEIGLGTWRYKGGAQPLRKGIELGAALIDTAEGYYTEEVIGEAISGIRDKVFIATKVSGRHLGYDDLLQSAEESLYKLGTDYIDLYQIHWPNPTYPIRETMQAMGELVDRGLVRFIGVSNFDIDEMEEAQSYLNNYAIVSNQVRYNLNDRSIEMDLLPYCEERDITIFAYTPLDDGNLAKKPSLINSNKMNILDDISQEIGKTMGQVAINWCTSRKKVIAIPKSNSQERIIENCKSSGWRLSQKEINRLNEAF